MSSELEIWSWKMLQYSLQSEKHIHYAKITKMLYLCLLYVILRFFSTSVIPEYISIDWYNDLHYVSCKHKICLNHSQICYINRKPTMFLNQKQRSFGHTLVCYMLLPAGHDNQRAVTDRSILLFLSRPSWKGRITVTIDLSFLTHLQKRKWWNLKIAGEDV